MSRHPQMFLTWCANSRLPSLNISAMMEPWCLKDSPFVSIPHRPCVKSAIQYSTPDTTGAASQQKISVTSWQTLLVSIVLEKSHVCHHDDARWFDRCLLKVHGAMATIVNTTAATIRETRDKADPAIYGQEKRTVNTWLSLDFLQMGLRNAMLCWRGFPWNHECLYHHHHHLMHLIPNLKTHPLSVRLLGLSKMINSE